MKSLPKILTAIILTLMVSGAYSNFLNNGGKWLQNAEPWVEGDTIIDPYSPATGSDTLPLDTEEVVMKYLPGEVRDTAALFADTVRHTQILAKIALIARSYGDSIVLRWAPEDYVVWQHLNEVGVNVLRLSKGSDFTIDTLAYALKPASYDRFRAVYPDTLDSIPQMAMQLLYGGGEIKPDQTESAAGTLGSLRELYDDQQMHYGMAMLAAELRPDVANMMALRLTDKTAERGKEYEYIVQPTVMDTTGHLPIMSGHVESIKNERYTPEPFAPEMGDSAVAHCSTRIWWEDLGRYTSYEIYRRPTGSGENWKKLNERPYVIMHNDLDTLDCYYNDEVESPGSYDYKIYAHDAFGDLTEASPIHTVQLKDMDPPRAPEIYLIDIDRPDTMDLMKEVKATIYFEKDTMEADMLGYEVLYNNEKTMGDEWKKLTTQMLAPSDTMVTLDVSDLSSGYVCIAAYDAGHNESRSLPRYMRLTDLRSPAAPAGLSAQTNNEDGTITLSWQIPADDVDYYEVAFANDTTHEWMLQSEGKLEDTIFVDTVAMDANQRYIYYKVRAVDYSSNVGDYSEVLQVLRPSDLPPSVAHLDSAWTDEQGVHMHWVAPNEAQLAKMVVYRRLEGTQQWINIGSYDGDSLALTDWTAEVTDMPEYNRSHRYEYMAQCVSLNGMASDESLVYSASWEGDAVFSASIRLFATYDKSKGETRLAWELDEAPKYPGDWYFCIYRQGPDDKDARFLISADSHERSFTDYLLNDGETASYYIFIQYKDGRESEHSNTASVSAN